MNRELMEALDMLERQKNVRKEVVLKAIEEALLTACKQHFKNSKCDNITVNMDYTTGDYEINMAKEVVENVEDPMTQISLPNARVLDKKAVYGSTVYVKVNSGEFGRIAAQNAKNVLVQKLRDEENRAIYDKYKVFEKDLISGIISRHFERKGNDGKPASSNVSVNIGSTEATLTAGEQVRNEEYPVNKRMRFYVVEVKDLPKGPKIMLSRSRPELVKRLFEAEVAEIKDGTVEIKAISREAGSRTKMAVWSNDPNVDAVGACVGVNSSRVNAVVSELGGEKIDIVNWDENDAQFIENALSPSKVIYVNPDVVEHAALVVVPDSQLSLAIGKAGQNARLAAKLTGYKIDIKSQTQAEDEGIFDNIDNGGDDGYEEDDGYGYGEGDRFCRQDHYDAYSAYDRSAGKYDGGYADSQMDYRRGRDFGPDDGGYQE